MLFCRKYFLLLHVLLFLSPVTSVASNPNNFLIITDIHLNKSFPHTMEISPSGNNGANDLDELSFEKLLQELSLTIRNGVIPTPDFILVLGDIAGHIRFGNATAESEAIVFNRLKTYFPNTPILYTFGNNDSLKKNYGPFFDNERQEEKSPYELAVNKASLKSGFLSTGIICSNRKLEFPCLISEDRIRGFYSAYLKPGLRFISLNTVLFSSNGAKDANQDAMEELGWFHQELKLAKQNHEMVLIAMHIPPGNNVYDHSAFWLPEYRDGFLNTIKEYQTSIAGLLAGHTHAEELKIIQDASHNNLAGVYFTASLSTSHGNNPGVKTFYIAQKDGKWNLSDYEAFYFIKNSSTISLKKLYRFSTYYCSNNGTTETMLNCLNNFNPDRMKKYFSAGNPNFSGVMNAPKDVFLTSQ